MQRPLTVVFTHCGRLCQELIECKASIERHGLGRNNDANRFREDIEMLSNKLQAIMSSLRALSACPLCMFVGRFDPVAECLVCLNAELCRLQAAEAEMYRVNKEKQAAAVESQRQRHTLEGQLAAAEHGLKHTTDERDRARRDNAGLERDLKEERDANQEMVARLNRCLSTIAYSGRAVW